MIILPLSFSCPDPFFSSLIAASLPFPPQLVCPLLLCHTLLCFCHHLSYATLHELQRSTQANTGQQPRQHRAIDLVWWERWWVSWSWWELGLPGLDFTVLVRSAKGGLDKLSIGPTTVSQCWSIKNAWGLPRMQVHGFKLYFKTEWMKQNTQSLMHWTWQ